MNLSSESIRVFDFIIAFKKENDGVAPALAEIRDACGISSKSVAKTRVAELENAGFVVRIKCGEKYSARGIKVIGGEWTYKEPIRSTLLRARVETGEIENAENND